MSIVEKCKGIVSGKEEDFIGGFLGVEIPPGHNDSCALLMEAFAQACPTDFVRAVGAFLHDCVEVA